MGKNLLSFQYSYYDRVINICWFKTPIIHKKGVFMKEMGNSTESAFKDLSLALGELVAAMEDFTGAAKRPNIDASEILVDDRISAARRDGASKGKIGLSGSAQGRGVQMTLHPVRWNFQRA